MKMLAKVVVAFIVGSFYMPCMAQSEDLSCPNTIASNLCDQLKNRDDNELVSFYVMFKRAPVDAPITDPLKDTAAPAGSSAMPSEYATYTQELFSKYDLRWPEDTGNRASTPTRIEGTYYLFAAKTTVLAFSTENFVQEVQRWSPDAPAGNKKPAKIGLKPPSSQYFFNVRGQQLKGSDMSTPPLKIWISRP